jgi:hypothetical protein
MTFSLEFLVTADLEGRKGEPEEHFSKRSTTK